MVRELKRRNMSSEIAAEAVPKSQQFWRNILSEVNNKLPDTRYWIKSIAEK